MRNLRLTLCYDGTGYRGWQVQPGRATIQGTLSEAVRRVTGETAVVHGSGRTDAGVHALAQVAHVHLEAKLPAENLTRALNRLLPAAIRVLAAEEAAPAFHARRDAVAKLYRYRLLRTRLCPPFLARYVHHFPYPLDEAAMIAAAADFAGRHDFASFATRGGDADPSGANGGTTVRTVHQSRLWRRGDELVYEVVGSGFLRHMVRNMMGWLIEIGRARRGREELEVVLAARDRSRAGRRAPARGLYLVKVFYDGEETAEHTGEKIAGP